MSERSGGGEARREARHDLVSFTWYKVLPIGGAGASGDTPEGIARSCDLSSRGVGLVLSRPLAKDAWVFLEVGLSSGRVSMIGRVRHCRDLGSGLFRVGCAIEIVPPNDRQAVARFLGS
jgi:hypothetical protein